MNKTELIEKVTEKTGLSKRDATEVLTSFTSIVGDTLAAGDNVVLIGFGSFGVKERAAREARNPRTGEKVKVPATKTVYFKPGKGLKEKVNR